MLLSVTVLLITDLHERTLTVSNTVLQLSITECMNCNNITMESRTRQGLFLPANVYIHEFKTQNVLYIYMHVYVSKLRVLTNCTSHNELYVTFEI